MSKPLAIDLFTGLHGWAEALIDEGWDVVAFDLEDMCAKFGHPRKAGIQLVLQDVLTLHGSQFKNASLIVASPPCTEFSYRGRYGRKKNLPLPDLRCFDACFRIAAEARIPLVIENVVWAQKFVGPAKAHWGSRYLWGDVPPLLPYRKPQEYNKGDHSGLASRMWGSKPRARKKMTAELSRIPEPLARHIARVFKP